MGTIFEILHEFHSMEKKSYYVDENLKLMYRFYYLVDDDSIIK